MNRRLRSRPASLAGWLLVAGLCTAAAGCATARFDATQVARSETPALSVHASIPEADKVALQSLAAATHAVLLSPEFRQNAALIEGTYPTIFLNDALGSRSPSEIAGSMFRPGDDWTFAATPILFGNGAITGFDKGLWRMAINSATLAQWRSTDVVERSCALNTVAHESMHTLLSSPEGSAMVFIDGGLDGWPSRRAGTTGSYVMGQLAQCTYLAQQGRIAAAAVPQCVPVFYSKPSLPFLRGKFAVGRCTQFPGTTPVTL